MYRCPVCDNEFRLACHVCGTLTAEHGTTCSAFGVADDWDHGSDFRAECPSCRVRASRKIEAVA